MLVLVDDCGGGRCGRVGNSRVQRRCGLCSKLTFTKTTKKREKKKEPQYGYSSKQSDAQSLAMNRHGYSSAEIGGERRGERMRKCSGEQNVWKEV
jgi:hypothetical protein